MITRNRYNLQGDTCYQGLSTDEKPTENVPINSLFLELDTGDFYYAESQGSKGEPTKNVLISEQSISEWEQEAINLYSYTFNDFLEFPDTITVVFDGTEYTVEKQNTEYENEYFYGGYADGNIDFSTYPFAIFNGFDEDAWAIQIFAGNNNEHTVEIYTLGNGDTPAVWKKVGSGASES